jgi:murein L,D-transpeptidase YcbB/YkuD
MHTKIILTLIQAFIAITVTAQVHTDEIQLILKAGNTQPSLQYPDHIAAFYKINNYSYAWLNNDSNTQDLLNLLRSASDLGLQEEDYQFDLIQSLRNNNFIRPARHDSLITEVRLTDAAIHFFRDIAFGNRKPAIGYNGINYSPDCFDIPALLATAIAGNRLPGLVKELETDAAGYQTLKDWLSVFNQSISDSLYKEIKITSTAITGANRPLVNRLYYLGIIDTLHTTFTDAVLKGKIRSAQRLFNLMDNGTLNKLTLEALNTPLAIRIEAVKAAMNTIRWLRCASMQSPIFVVNVPSANLLVQHQGKVLLQSKVIVGKPSTRTPLLASIITDVILYPYWTVPNNIATRELLPLIQRNTGYLTANSMQVLTKAGKIVDPYTIDWSVLSPSYFPYVLRQSTGCDNSLGIVKLNFYSPYSVYLHDTPWKVLFNFNRRYFSHGCIRVEKAVELARFLLKENTIAIDTLEEKGCLRHQSPLSVTVRERIPVFVLYNTAWMDSSGVVQFNEDIYRRINYNQQVYKKSGN